MGSMNPILSLDAGIVVLQSAGADQIVGRIDVLSIHAFGHQAPNLLLGEVDCRRWVGK